MNEQKEVLFDDRTCPIFIITKLAMSIIKINKRNLSFLFKMWDYVQNEPLPDGGLVKEGIFKCLIKILIHLT